MRGSLRLRVMTAPTRSPMGVMLISAPRVKNMMPTTIMAAPSKKAQQDAGRYRCYRKAEHQHNGHNGQHRLQRLQKLFPQLGGDRLRMMSTAFRLYPVCTLLYKIYL